MTAMYLRQVFCFALLFGVAWVVNAQEASPKPSSDSIETEVQRLVRELDASQLARRNAAEQALQKLGEDALPFLPDPSAQQPPEVKQRLERVRERIAKQSAGAKVVRSSTDVRLGDAATLGKALEAISRDSGIEFEHMADEDTPITPYPSALPFWHALDHVLDETKLDIDFYSGENDSIALQPRAKNRPSRVDSAAYAGLYRLEPVIVTSRRILQDVSLSSMNVEVEISWKPDAHPVGITLPLAQISATLDDGATVKAQQSAGTIDIAPSDEIATSTIQLPLALPAGFPTKITSLSGKIQSMLPGEIKPFEFALKEGPKTLSEDFVTVKLEELRKNGALHEIRLGVEYKSPGKAMESHRGWLLGNEVYVQMPDGSRQDHLGYELYRHNENGIGIGYMFDIGDQPGESKLIYKTATAVVHNEIDFVIQDIPLP
jgi:hypothetical protein